MGYCSKCHKELVRDGVKGRGTVASPPEKPQGSTNERKQIFCGMLFLFSSS